MQPSLADTIIPILHMIGDMLLKGVPTSILLLLTIAYLRHMFFKPLAVVLQVRYDATVGAKKAAEAALAKAEARAEEYEVKLRAARNEVYTQQETDRKALLAAQSAQIAEAKKRSDTLIADAKAALVAEVATSRTQMSAEADKLADTIASTILRRSA